MAKTAKGRDIISFITEGMTEEQYYEDNEIELYSDSGEFILEPNEDYPLSGLGYIGKNGGDGSEQKPFAHFFNKWYKARMIGHVTIEIAKEKVEDLKAMLKMQGYKVL